MKKHWIKRVHHLPKGFCLLGVIGLALLLIGCGKTGEKPLIEQEPLLYNVDKANQVLKGKGFEGKTVDEIIVHTAGKKEYTAIFNNVAQAWNHAFFWKCLKPGGGTVSDELADWIRKIFGGGQKPVWKWLDLVGR